MNKGLYGAASESIKTANTIFNGWNEQMLKFPRIHPPKKIEVHYVKNNGEEDRGIQDYWEIPVKTLVEFPDEGTEAEDVDLWDQEEIIQDEDY